MELGRYLIIVKLLSAPMIFIDSGSAKNIQKRFLKSQSLSAFAALVFPESFEIINSIVVAQSIETVAINKA